MKYTSQTDNTITYINKGNTVIKLEKDCPMCNRLFCLDAPEEDIYSEQDGEDII